MLAADERITVLGLCNFDTKRTLEIIEAGIPIATNQVQFSIIDSRPRYAMADICLKHNVKLTTYGTLVRRIEHIHLSKMKCTNCS